MKNPFQPKKTAKITPMAAGAVGAVAGAAISAYLSKAENRQKINDTFNHVTTKAKDTINALKSKADKKATDIQTTTTPKTTPTKGTGRGMAV